MFATRTNQENAVYQQQQATAAKNNGVNSLAPKTPGYKAPKTPFKVTLNDENVTVGAGKTGGKGQNGLFGDGKSGKVDPSAFVTPAGPRNRAPLGNKTTNARANAFQTPAAPPVQDQLSAKPTSPRMRRSKVKVLQSQVETQDVDAEREVEYMPPREVPLPDHPEDWPLDRSYPQFQGKNFTRGWYSEFASKRDDDDDSELSDFDEKVRNLEKQKAKQQTVIKAKPVPTNRKPLAERAPSTIVARKASSALGSRGTGPRSFAAPTAATKARVPGLLASRKPMLASTTSGNSRHTAARAASNTTLGYSKGRAVSGAARRPLEDIHKKPEPQTSTSSAPFSSGTSLDQLLGLSLEDDREDDELGARADPLADEDEDEALKDFQLDAPEL
ncbi:hypothetical protein Q7P37_002590 [Cladosporium fusiforme]